MGADHVKVYAVVPLSAPPRIKTRLAGALQLGARAALARWMAGRVLDAVRASGAIAEVAVVSPDAEALAWAAGRGAVALHQEGRGLNAALEIGRQWALSRDADALLVLLGDLPYLTPRDVSALVRLLPDGDAPAAVLAPDRHERGTNVLLLRPPDALPFAFGRESFHRHEARALALGVRAVWYTSEGTRSDVDTPDDLAVLVASGLWRPAAVS
ncbi:MAG TPA: 2-phospho-L-lactate guanylyltransferase [Ktedonobacterales bacterium]